MSAPTAPDVVPEPPDLPAGADASTDQYTAAAALERYRATLRAWDPESSKVAELTGRYEQRVAELEHEISTAEEEYNTAHRDRWWALDDEFYGHYYELIKGGVDRARASAETVQKAATAIATLYSGAIAVSFSVDDRRLPLRGLIPLVFLGLAVVLSTAYLAWIGDRSTTIESGRAEAEGRPTLRQQYYAEEFATMVSRMGRQRASSLRAAVVALTLGLLFVAAPFIEVDASNTPTAAETVVADQALPEWPTAEEFAAYDAEVGAALMEVRAAEVSELRSAARAGTPTKGAQMHLAWLPDAGWGWAVAALLGLAAVAVTSARRRPAPPFDVLGQPDSYVVQRALPPGAEAQAVTDLVAAIAEARGRFVDAPTRIKAELAAVVAANAEVVGRALDANGDVPPPDEASLAPLRVPSSAPPPPPFWARVKQVVRPR